MRYEDGVHVLEEVAMRLDAMSFEKMQAYALKEDGAENDVDEGIDLTTPVLTTKDAPIASIDASRSASDAVDSAMTSSMREEWAHITLRPGLILLVRQPPSDEARSLARKIATISDIDASFD